MTLPVIEVFDRAEVKESPPDWDTAAPEYLAEYKSANPVAVGELDSIAGALAARGAILVDLTRRSGPADSLLQILASFALPIRVFGNHNFWRPIGVLLDKDPSRSEGTGDGPLHMDFVNASRPPKFVCLYCERSDPSGGGLSALAEVEPSIRSLDDSDQDELRRPIFRDGQVVGLVNVGIDINPFAVLDDASDWHYRYTSSLLSNGDKSYPTDALRRLESALRARQLTFAIPERYALIFDNSRYVHARISLGDSQDAIPESSRRLLQQGFATDLDLDAGAPLIIRDGI